MAHSTCSLAGAPVAGLGGTIVVAFVGALILLAALHLLHAAFYRQRPVT